MAENEPVLYREADGLAWITFNRPKALNALNPETLHELSALLDRLKVDAAVKGVILTGTGDAFSAGADIRLLNRSTPLEVREFARLAVAVNHQIETLGKVVVAAINGYALGGGLELAEACMLRVAVGGAMLGHPEVRIGAVAGFGGTTRLPRLIGKGRAAELLLTGRLITAEEALRLGLVNQVVERDALLAQTETLMREVVAQAPLAVKLTWDAIHHGLNVTLEESAALGADCFGLIAASEDFRIGTKAFLEKKTPAFTGR
jgi:enoyl-CoA hydratase